MTTLIERSIALMDVVADFYSKPQVGGAIKVGSRKIDNYRKFGIPIVRNRVGIAAEGVAEAVKAAGGKAIQKFVREPPPKEGEERELKPGSNKFRQRFVGKGTSSKSMNDGPKKKKKSKPKHKRSKIDDVLGDDSY